MNRTIGSLIAAVLFCGVASAQVDIFSVQDYDGYLHLYEGSFDPLDQLTNLVAGNDDGAGGIGTSDLTGLTLTPGVDYILVTSGFGAGDEGTFTNEIVGAITDPAGPFMGSNVGGPTWDRPIGAGPSISGLGPVTYSAQTFQVVPEPTSAVLLLVGLVGFLRRR